MAPLSPMQVESWREYNAAPWGRLRLELIWTMLERHVQWPPPRVLDAGCGLAELAIRLAQAGSDVVVATDASEAMLSAARERAAETRVRWLAADLDDTVEELAGERFDLVLCHNVLGYVPDPARATIGLASLLSPEGTLSLTLLNRAAEPLRQAFLLRDLDAALAVAERGDSARLSRVLAVDSRLDELDDAAGWFVDAGLELTATAGLLLVNHYLGADDETKHTPEGWDAIRRLELALMEREPYLRIAPFLHLLGRASGRAAGR